MDLTKLEKDEYLRPAYTTLPIKVINGVRLMASERGTTMSKILGGWILERYEQEIKRK